MDIESHKQPSTSTNYSHIPRNLRRGIFQNKARGFEFDRVQGKLIDQRDRHWVLRVYYMLKSQDVYVDEPDNDLRNLVANIACCSIDSVNAILNADTYSVEDNRGHSMPKKFSQREEETIRTEIVENLKNDLEKGVPVSSKNIRAWLKEQKNIDISVPTLYTYLRSWDISWRRLKSEEYRKERESVLLQKRDFLENILDEFQSCHHVRKCQCPRPRKLVFVDESYVHEHHVSNYGLTIGNFPLRKPSGKGRRVIMAAAFTEEGFLAFNPKLKKWGPDMESVYENGSVRYWTANVGGDYHKNFDANLFQTYFEECVLANLTEPSIIILDRAPYHTTYPEGQFYPSKAKKNELKEWLWENNISFEEGLLKEDLKVLAISYWRPPETIIEDMAKKHGLEYFGREHQVLYLPPYHPEYNAIEMAWGRVKHFVGKNPPYSLNVLLTDTLQKAFNDISTRTAFGICSHVKNMLLEDGQRDLDPDDITIRMQDYQDYG